MTKNIEVEIRSLITKQEYIKLNKVFKKTGKYLGTDKQVSYYFDGEQDLRIQQNTKYSKIWLKKGKLHDEQREEIEIKVAKNDFKLLEQLFATLGYMVQIKWFRTRNNYKWKDYSVALDFTKGYGYIFEIEKLCSEKDKGSIVAKIKSEFEKLGVKITPREVFEEKYNYYKKNWKKLV